MTKDLVESPLQTVDRALQVLLSYSERRVEWGVLELADEFGWNKSTSQRLLAALAARGFLVADPNTRRYSLGPAMWRMAALWERGGGLARLAEQEIAPLAQVTGHAVTFTVPDGFYVRCIAAIDGHYGPLRAHPLVGDLYPAHAGATSRAYFAFLDPMARRNLLAGRPFTRFTELTQIDPDAVDRLLDETYRTGWAYSEGEYDPTTRAIAAPVIVGNRPVGSMSVVEPKAREHERDLRDFVPALLEATASLADVLSNRPPARPQRDWRRGRSVHNRG